MKLKLIKDWKRGIKSYSFLSIIANIFTAISVSALAVLGVLSSDIAFPLLVFLAVSFGVVGAIGRFIDQTVDDIIECEDDDAE